ncbi:hypothetical protein C2845_PM14G13240 [Panicum miliaceum]|uniref:Uncharacterized protein n=1 Tax=Panicum miliaceum TaxID=4540 RepID=A0A3L6PNF1_PANMI|nr:hypothetical protein C2845_PM14G13240 [Panicum miliaceum]
MAVARLVAAAAPFPVAASSSRAAPRLVVLASLPGSEIPVTEMVGAAVGMEFWARWVHRAPVLQIPRPSPQENYLEDSGPIQPNSVRFGIIRSHPSFFSNSGEIPTTLVFRG